MIVLIVKSKIFSYKLLVHIYYFKTITITNICNPFCRKLDELLNSNPSINISHESRNLDDLNVYKDYQLYKREIIENTSRVTKRNNDLYIWFNFRVNQHSIHIKLSVARSHLWSMHQRKQLLGKLCGCDDTE